MGFVLVFVFGFVVGVEGVDVGYFKFDRFFFRYDDQGEGDESMPNGTGCSGEHTFDLAI